MQYPFFMHFISKKYTAISGGENHMSHTYVLEIELFKVTWF